MTVTPSAQPPTTVTIPPKAGDDILVPLQTLLHGLNLWATDEEANAATGITGIFTAPPASVALIQSSATALTKAWAGGLGVSVAAVWAGVGGWWATQDHAIQGTVLWAAAIATGTAILAIGYILGSDLRGRSTASVATINARAKVADAMLGMSATVASGDPISSIAAIGVSPALPVTWTARPSADEPGWLAIATNPSGTPPQVLLVKGSVQEWADIDQVVFGAPTPQPDQTTLPWLKEMLIDLGILETDN